VLEKVKNCYLQWYQYYQNIPKLHRHTLGQRIDSMFVEIVEAISFASFLSPAEKAPYVRLSIRKLDTLKILLMVMWEMGSLDTKKYVAISLKLDDIGTNLGGWHGQVLSKLKKEKQNSPGK
jgi:hypothetical protein